MILYYALLELSYVQFETSDAFILMASQFEVSTSGADKNLGSEETDLLQEVAGWNLGQDANPPPDWDFSYSLSEAPRKFWEKSRIKLNLFFIYL